MSVSKMAAIMLACLAPVLGIALVLSTAWAGHRVRTLLWPARSWQMRALRTRGWGELELLVGQMRSALSDRERALQEGQQSTDQSSLLEVRELSWRAEQLHRLVYDGVSGEIHDLRSFAALLGEDVDEALRRA
jgi:hypothetical protein